MDKWLQITPLDPLMSRDGRPFNATPGSQAYSLQDLSPSTVAGSLRTMLGKQLGEGSQDQERAYIESIHRMRLRGPLYESDGMVLFPWPQDMYAYEYSPEHDTAHKGNLRLDAIRPQRSPHDSVQAGFLGTGKGGHFEEELWPPELPLDSKVWSNAPAYISAERMMDWLSEAPASSKLESLRGGLNEWNDLTAQEKLEHPHYMSSLPIDQREHTEIDLKTQGARDERLFTTRYLAFPHSLHVLASVAWPSQLPWPHSLSTIHSLGGKRRLVHIQELETPPYGLQPSKELLHALEDATYIRLVLATPAFFQKGWLPGWLDENLLTKADWPGQASGVTLQLRWACISGYVPISGWSHARARQQEAEKSVRRMVPAGSVYFFQVVQGNPADLASLTWLMSVSDQHRRHAAFDDEDGFGLALWGKWWHE
ncbi:type III-B CRISPR module-associated protein Cmr3 [Paenibacillus sp. YYML68]|uniref:type III-B CRISPR module-associated protein Cmr3 n=1 Tax=Paenibacillus sp. YYML68 TaxID=2909250 RepID=UPI0024929118|nr:type III-B CRISPR module-associated protein Cmr3 [Paenibacillus sp. YYML68]